MPVNAIGPYTLIRLIARGGMGAVYLGQERDTGRYAAVKVLDADVEASADSEFAARFRREGHILATLNHPHIVKVFDVGYSDHDAYIAMEYLNYGSLKDRLARYQAEGERMPVAEALEIGRQIASALGYAHKRGLIHRDVKPSNIMLAAGWRYVLTDFGIVYLPQATRLTREPGRAMGTAEYISPEQIDQKPFDGRVDIYALGVVLYEMLIGQPPFVGEVEMVLLYQHLHQAPTPLASLRADVPTTVCTLIERALAKDPADRFRTADEMESALEAELRKIEHPAKAMSFLAGVRNLLNLGLHHRQWEITIIMLVAILSAGLALSQFGISLRPAHGQVTPTITPTSQHTPTNTPNIRLAKVYFIPKSNRLALYQQPTLSSSHQSIAIRLAEALTVTGRARDAAWVYIQLPDQRQSWVVINHGHLRGTLSTVPIVPVPNKETSE